MALTDEQKRLLNRQNRVFAGVRMGALLDEASTISTAELEDQAVTEGKIGANAVSFDKLSAALQAMFQAEVIITAGQAVVAGDIVRVIAAGTGQKGGVGFGTLGVAAESAGAGDPCRVWVFGVHDVVANGPILAGSTVKGGYDGKVAMFSNSAATVISGNGANFGNQPAGDTVDVASDNAGDTTQVVTVIGTDNADALLTEDYILTGAATIAGASAFKNVCGVILSAACAGTITVTENSGGLTITTIAAGNLSSGILEPAGGTAIGQSYNQQLTVTDLANGEFAIVYGTAPDGSAQREVVTGTAGVDTTTGYYNTVDYLMVGDCGATTRALTAAIDYPWLLAGSAVEAAMDGATFAMRLV